MDSRHEPLEQEVLNELIHIINNFIRENTDEVISKDLLRDDIRDIAKYIYDYAEIRVDIDGIISKRNFLSIDMIPLPQINDLIKHNDVNLFSKVEEGIMRVLKHRSNGEVMNRKLQQQIAEILVEYHDERYFGER